MFEQPSDASVSEQASKDNRVENFHTTETISTDDDGRVSITDKMEEDVAERVASDAINEALAQLLATPSTTDLAHVRIETESTETTKQDDEEPSLDSLVQTTEQMRLIPEEQEIPETAQITSTIESVQQTSSKEHQPLLDDKTKAVEAEHLSSEALTEAVREILATPLTVHLPSVDHEIETATKTEQLIDKPTDSIIITSTEDVTTIVPAPVTMTEEEQLPLRDMQQDKVQESTRISSITDITQEAERLSSEALTETVREILATPLTAHLPSVDHTAETTTKTEQIVEQPSSSLSSPAFQQITTVITSPVTTTTETSTNIETVQGTTSEDRRPSAEDTIKEVEAEHLSSEALIEAVREILATPLTVHLPSVDHTVETTIKTEERVEKSPEILPTTDSEQVTTSETLPVTTTEEQISPRDSQQNEILFTTETKETTKTEDLLPSAEDTTKEVEAERLSSEALTEAVREILATPLAVHLPSVDHTTETTTIKDTLPESSKISFVTETKQEATTDETTKEPEAERLSSEALTEAVREILSTPVKIHLPSVDIKTEEPLMEKVITTTTTTTVVEAITDENQQPSEAVEQKKEDEPVSTESTTEKTTIQIGEIVEKPSAESLAPQSEQVTTTIASPDRITTEEREESTTTKQDEFAESSKTVPVVETVQETTSEVRPADTEDTIKEIETEHLSSEALTQAVREILATPLTVHLPTIDIKSETIESTEQPLTTTSSEVVQKTDVIPDETILQKTTTTTTVVEETTTENQQPTNTVKERKEDVQEIIDDVRQPSLEEAERISSAPSVAVDHETVSAPTIKDKIETTNESEEVKAITEEIPSIQPQLTETVEKESLTSKLSSSESDQIPLRSTDIEISEQSNKESPLQDDFPTSEVKTVSSESEFVFRPIVPAISISHSVDESLSDDDNESVSSSLYNAANNTVTDAFVDAFNVLEQSTPNESDTQLVSHDDDYSTSGLTNIVNNILNLPNKTTPEPSLPHEDSKIIITSKPDFDKHINTTEFTNIVNTDTKTLNTHIDSPEQSEKPDEIPLQRASAVQPILIFDDLDNDISSDNVPTFFIPGTPTPEDRNFNDLYEHRHFISAPDQESPLHFSPIDRQESAQSTIQTEEKKNIPNSPLAYYELQDQRHLLMSPQESVENDKEETKPSSLTTWTTVQSFADFEETEKKPEISDINLDDHAYEYARRFDLESPSVVSHLPTNEYGQVFGISDDIVNTVDDMTYHIEQILSTELKNNQPPITSDEVKSISSEPDENSQLDELQSSFVVKDTPVSDNVKRITEALDALESDLLEQNEDIPSQRSSVLKTIEHFISEQELSESDRLSTAIINDIEQTLEDQTSSIPIKDKVIDEELLPKEIEQGTLDEKPKDEITSNIELDSRYSTLLDRIDNLKQPLLDSQSSPSSVSEKETITTEVKEEKEDERQLHQRYDTLIDHVNTLEKATNKSLIVDTIDTDKLVVTLPFDEQIIISKDEISTGSDVKTDDLVKTMEQILATPFRTVINPYEKMSHEEHIDDSGLETALEQMLASTQYSTTYAKLTPPEDTVTSSDKSKDQSEEIRTKESQDEMITSTSIDQNVVSNEEDQTAVKEKDSSTIIEKATSIVTDVISTITGVLPTAKTTEDTASTVESTVSQEELPTSPVTEEETVSPKTSVEREEVSQEQPSSTRLIEIVKSFIPFTTPTTTTTDGFSSEVQIPAARQEQEIVSSTKTTSSLVETQESQDMSRSAPEDSTSSDVKHEYEQPPKSVDEQKDSLTFIDQPTSKTIHETASTIETTISQDRVPDSTVADENVIVSRPSEEKQEIELQKLPSTSLLETKENFVPSTPQPLTTEKLISEEQSSTVEEDQGTVAISTTKTIVTTINQEDLETTTTPVVESQPKEDILRSAAGDSTISDVTHEYEQPILSRVEEKDSSTVIGKDESTFTYTIYGDTSALAVSKPTEETVSTVNSTITQEKTVVSKPQEKKEVDQQQPSSTGLSEIMTSLLPTGLISKATDVVSSEQQIPEVKEDQEAAPSATKEATVTTVDEEDITRTTQPVVEIQPQEDVSSPVPGYFISSDVYHAYKQPVEPMIEEKQPPTITDKAASLVANIISSVTSILPSSESAEERTSTVEPTTSEENVPPTTVTEEEVIVSKPKEEELEIDQQQPSTGGLLEIMTNLLPSSLRSEAKDVVSSEEQIPTDKKEPEAVPCETTETTISEEYITTITQPRLDIQREDISDLVPGYFTSNDVYHGYKQPVESTVAEGDLLSDTNNTTSLISRIVSTVTDILPTSKAAEETTSTIESTVSQEKAAPPNETEEETTLSKPLQGESELNEEQASIISQEGIMTTSLPSTAVSSTTTDKITSDEQIPVVQEDHDTVSTTMTEATVDEEDVTRTTQPLVETQEKEVVLSLVPGYFTSSDVYHAYKEPMQPIIKAKSILSAIQSATSVLTDFVNVLTTASSIFETTEENITSVKSTVTDENVKAPNVAEEEFIVSKPLEQNEDVLNATSDYSTGSGVTHDYSQPMKSDVEEKESSTVIDKAASLVTDIISSVTGVLPVPKASEETSFTIESTISQKDVPTSIVTEEEMTLLKSSKQKEEVSQEQPSPTGLLEIVKSFIPFTTTTTSDIIGSKEQILEVKEQSENVSSSTMETTIVTTVSHENLIEPTPLSIKTHEIEDVTSPVPGYFTSSDVYHAYKQPVEPMIEEKQPSTITDKATSLVTNIISNVTTALPLSESAEEKSSTVESTITDEIVPTTTITEQEVAVSKPKEEKVEVDQQQPSSTGLLEIMTSLLPTSLRSKTKEVVSSEEQIPEVKQESEKASAFLTETTVTTVDAEDVSRTTQPAVETQPQEDVVNLASGYFTSSDVYHAYKQPVEPMIEEKQPLTITDKATSLVTNIISTVASVLPSSESAEERTSTVESTISEENVPPTTVTEEEVIVSKPKEEKVNVDQQQQPSTAGLLEIMTNLLPSSLRSKTRDVVTLEEQIPAVKEEQEAVPSATTEPTISEEYITTIIHVPFDIQEREDVSGLVPGYFISRDVYHAYKHPVEPVVEEKQPSTITDKATTFVTDVISSITGVLPTSKDTDETTLSAQSTTPEQKGVTSTVEERIPLVEEDQKTVSSATTETIVSEEYITTVTQPRVEIERDDISYQVPGHISNVTNIIPISKDTEETTSEEVVPASTVAGKEVYQEQPSSTGLFGIMKSLLPASLRSRTVDESNSEKQIPSEEEREETLSSSTTKTIVTTVGEEDLTKTTQPVVETLQKEDISGPITDYSISDDVDTTDKQSVEQLVEENDSSTSLMSKLTSLVTDTIATIQTVLPTSASSNTDADQQKPSSEDEKTEIFESRVSI